MIGMYLINDYFGVLLLVTYFIVFLFINYVIIADIEDGDVGGGSGGRG